LEDVVKAKTSNIKPSNPPEGTHYEDYGRKIDPAQQTNAPLAGLMDGKAVGGLDSQANFPCDLGGPSLQNASSPYQESASPTHCPSESTYNWLLAGGTASQDHGYSRCWLANPGPHAALQWGMKYTDDNLGCLLFSPNYCA